MNGDRTWHLTAFVWFCGAIVAGMTTLLVGSLGRIAGWW